MQFYKLTMGEGGFMVLEIFEIPEICVLEFCVTDVITTSSDITEDPDDTLDDHGHIDGGLL